MEAAETDWIPILNGQAWMLGLDVPIALIGDHPDTVLQEVTPGLADSFPKGDILVAGSFGAGIRDEKPVRALLELGVGAIVADRFDPEFVQQALALGLRTAQISESLGIQTGDRLRVDFEGARIANQSTGDRYPIRNTDQVLLARLRQSISRIDA